MIENSYIRNKRWESGKERDSKAFTRKNAKFRNKARWRYDKTYLI